MAVPKRNTSRARKGKRRSHLAMKAVHLVSCARCKSAAMPHRVCPNCGYYRGRSVVEKDEI